MTGFWFLNFGFSFSGPVVAEAIFLNREEIPVYPIYRDPVSENTDDHVVFLNVGFSMVSCFVLKMMSSFIWIYDKDCVFDVSLCI